MKSRHLKTHTDMFEVLIFRPVGKCGMVIDARVFRSERKARDYYAESLVRYPNYEVKFEKIEL